MANLISYSQQQAIKKISANNQFKYDQLAAEVEQKDLRNLLGIALLQDIQATPASTENAKLLDGGTYENYLEQTITFKGLRYILAYLIYAKYIGESFVNDTFTGMVSKNRQESQLISEGTMKRLINENREIALQEWELIEEFLNITADDYPLWLYGKRQKPFTPRMYGVRKTVKGNKRYEERSYHFPVIPKTD